MGKMGGYHPKIALEMGENSLCLIQLGLSGGIAL